VPQIWTKSYLGRKRVFKDMAINYSRYGRYGSVKHIVISATKRRCRKSKFFLLVLGEKIEVLNLSYVLTS
jgi:hypothetical protein